MPLYTKNDAGIAGPLNLEEYKPSTWRSLNNKLEMALDFNPLTQVAFIKNVGEAMTGIDVSNFDEHSMSDADLVNAVTVPLGNKGGMAARDVPKMSVEDQEKLFEAEGVKGKITPDPNWPEDVVRLMVEEKKEENARAFIAEKESRWQAILGLGPMVAGSMIDPINLASALLPGMPQARSLLMMQAAKGIAGRTGVRMLEGGLGGAFGAAALEPVIYSGQANKQADYTLTNSLLNLGVGFALGGVMRGVGGAIGEARVNYHNAHLKPGEMPRAHSWEYVPESSDSIALMNEHAARIEEAMRGTEAGKRMTPEELKQAATDNALLWDQWYRQVAYREKKSIGAVYKRWQIDYSGPEPRIVDTARPLAAITNWEKEAQALRDMGLDERTIELSIGKRPDYRMEYFDMDRAYDFKGAQELRETGTPEIVIEATYGKAPVQDIAGRGRLNHAPMDDFIAGYRFNRHGQLAPADPNVPEVKWLGTNREGQRIYLAQEDAASIMFAQPEFKAWDRIKSVMNKGDEYQIGRNHITGNETTAHVTFDEYGGGQIVLSSVVHGKTDHVRVLASWKDDAQSIRNWVGARQEVSYNQPAIQSGGNTLFQGGTAKPLIGKSTTILVASGKDLGHYEVRELADVIASHDPEKGFARRPEYPKEAQERPYHSDKGEQDKVTRNALEYNPDYIISDAFTPADGPPIITDKGITLGGNSRVMSLGLVYKNGGEKAALYRNTLMERASHFDIDRNQVAAMQQPVLVRVLDEQFDAAAMARKSREYNQGTSQRLQPEAEGISRGRFIAEDTFAAIADGLEEFGSLGAFVRSDKGRELIQKLVRDGVILDTEISALTNKAGFLNSEGYDLLQAALRGIVVQDYDVLSRLPGVVADKLDFAAASVMKLKAIGPEWDLSGAITQALRLGNEARINGAPLDAWLSQGNLLGNTHANPVLQALALTFENANGREIRTRLEVFAGEAKQAGGQQASLLGGTGPTPDTAFRTAFFKDAASVDGYHFGDFRPDSRLSHKAIKWAYEHGREQKHGTPTAERAHKKIEEKLQRGGLSQEQKAELVQIGGELVRFTGRIDIYEPQLGSFFSTKIDHPLDIPGPQKAFDAPVHTEPATPAPADPAAPVAPEAAGPAPVQTPAEPLAPASLEGARAKVDFLGERRAMITFFRAADLSSAPHELYHVIRRQLEDFATGQNASPFMRQMWQAAQDFVGAKPGEKWTVAMEEKFARAGERYLLEGAAPNARMEPLFERMKERFLEIYKDADAAGLEISDGMRRAFAKIFNPPMAESELRFRQAFLALMDNEWEREFYDPALAAEMGHPQHIDVGSVDGLETLAQSLEKDTNALLADLEASDVPHMRQLKEYLDLEFSLKSLDENVARSKDKAKWMEELFACETTRGSLSGL